MVFGEKVFSVLSKKIYNKKLEIININVMNMYIYPQEYSVKYNVPNITKYIPLVNLPANLAR